MLRVHCKEVYLFNVAASWASQRLDPDLRSHRGLAPPAGGYYSAPISVLWHSPLATPTYLHQSNQHHPAKVDEPVSWVKVGKRPSYILSALYLP